MRFSTEAANADVMGEDPQPSGGPEGMPRGRAETPTGRHDKRAGAHPKQGQARTSKDAGKPGKDINAAGFVKDKDASKP
jgi:hypothetical protein